MVEMTTQTQAICSIRVGRFGTTILAFIKPSMSTSNAFTCSCCGKVYDETPLCFGGQYPDYYFDVPPDEREERGEYSENLCVIDDHYFYRGSIPYRSLIMKKT